MQKIPGTTKYDADWQIVRAFIKGPKVSLEDKLKAARDYFEANQTLDAWHRVYNWLEGLSKGYKAADNQEAINRITQELKGYESQDYPKEPPYNVEEQRESLKSYSFDMRLGLWKDLFKTNEKWLKSGYFHKEANDFMDLLYSVFVEFHEENKIPENYSQKKLVSLRLDSEDKENTHKFFF